MICSQLGNGFGQPRAPARAQIPDTHTLLMYYVPGPKFGEKEVWKVPGRFVVAPHQVASMSIMYSKYNTVQYNTIQYYTELS